MSEWRNDKDYLDTRRKCLVITLHMKLLGVTDGRIRHEYTAFHFGLGFQVEMSSSFGFWICSFDGGFHNPLLQ